MKQNSFQNKEKEKELEKKERKGPGDNGSASLSKQPKAQPDKNPKGYLSHLFFLSLSPLTCLAHMSGASSSPGRSPARARFPPGRRSCAPGQKP
jgi:hypothetical protein